LQQAAPQQKSLAAQTPAVGEQGGATHVPPLHKLVEPSQCFPHVPQFIGSLLRFTQAPPQHMRPSAHATLQTPPPPVPP
jgi:hypothetical protein